MTAAWVSHRFADGDQIVCQVECDGEPYPQVVAELRAGAVALYREALLTALVVDREDEAEAEE